MLLYNEMHSTNPWITNSTTSSLWEFEDSDDIGVSLQKLNVLDHFNSESKRFRLFKHYFESEGSLSTLCNHREVIDYIPVTQFKKKSIVVY